MYIYNDAQIEILRDYENGRFYSLHEQNKDWREELYQNEVTLLRFLLGSAEQCDDVNSAIIDVMSDIIDAMIYLAGQLYEHQKQLKKA